MNTMEFRHGRGNAPVMPSTLKLQNTRLRSKGQKGWEQGRLRLKLQAAAKSIICLGYNELPKAESSTEFPWAGKCRVTIAGWSEEA
jgi:hypothetical protein